MDENGGPEVLASGLRFPEGPAVAPDGALWLVELQGGALVRVEGKKVRRYEVGGAPNGLAWRDDVAWFCDADGGSVRRLHPDGKVDTAANSSATVALTRPNDLAFDARGNLIFTCPGDSRDKPTGSVWCLRAGGDLLKIADGLFFPNGVAFAADGKQLVIAETYRHRLWKGGWDALAGTWLRPAVWAEVGGPIGPDGMAFDAAGSLHVAIFGRGEVVTVSPEGGIAGHRPTRGKQPTNVAFLPGGGMVVTEAERGELLLFPAAAPGAQLFGTKRPL